MRAAGSGILRLPIAKVHTIIIMGRAHIISVHVKERGGWAVAFECAVCQTDGKERHAGNVGFGTEL